MSVAFIFQFYCFMYLTFHSLLIVIQNITHHFKALKPTMIHVKVCVHLISSLWSLIRLHALAGIIIRRQKWHVVLIHFWILSSILVTSSSSIVSRIGSADFFVVIADLIGGWLLSVPHLPTEKVVCHKTKQCTNADIDSSLWFCAIMLIANYKFSKLGIQLHMII